MVVVLRGDGKLQELIEECRKRGLKPIITTRYAGQPLRYKGEPAVVFRGGLEGRGVIIVVSEETWEELDRSRF